MDFNHLILRDILGAEIDFESVIDEDLIERIVSNQFSVATMVDGQPNSQFKAQADGNPTNGGATSNLIMDTITEGVFERDDQYNTKYLEVTTGAASGKGILSRFPIVDCLEATQEFVVGENLANDNLFEAGMVNNDQFKIIGHVHDGIDGETIHFEDLIFEISPFRTEYTQAGKAQSVSRSSDGSDNANHILVLPTAGVDYWVEIRFDMKISGDGTASTADVEATFQVNGVNQHVISLSTDDVQSDSMGGTALVKAQNGHNVVVEAQINSVGSGANSFASFEVLAFQRIKS